MSSIENFLATVLQAGLNRVSSCQFVANPIKRHFPQLINPFLPQVCLGIWNRAMWVNFSAWCCSDYWKNGMWRHQGRHEEGKGEHNSWVRRFTVGGAEKSQQYHKYFLQYSTFVSDRPYVQIWERQTCFLPRSPSNLVTPLDVTGLCSILRKQERLRSEISHNCCPDFMQTWKCWIAL